MTMANKTVMITGAAGTLGRAVSVAFTAQGANLALVDVKWDILESAFINDDARRMLLPTDLLDPAAVAESVRLVRARFARIDVLCNIAGGFRMGDPVHATSDATWNFLLDINARTMLNACRAVVPGMIEAGGGKIINVGANSALKGVAQMGAYCASKSAVIRLTEAMAAELREKNINVNCVLPSIIDTPANRADMPGADFKRWVAPEDLASAMAFLASEGARAIHGAAIPVTGLS